VVEVEADGVDVAKVEETIHDEVLGRKLGHNWDATRLPARPSAVNVSLPSAKMRFRDAPEAV
jgi:hypothetical protein